MPDMKIVVTELPNYPDDCAFRDVYGETGCKLWLCECPNNCPLITLEEATKK